MKYKATRVCLADLVLYPDHISTTKDVRQRVLSKNYS